MSPKNRAGDGSPIRLRGHSGMCCFYGSLRGRGIHARIELGERPRDAGADATNGTDRRQDNQREHDRVFRDGHRLLFADE